MDDIRTTVIDEISQTLNQLEHETGKLPKALVIALSGGKDSVVLLDILSRLSRTYSLPPLFAFHVNHGLNSNADEWQAHCLTLCEQLDLPFHTVTVEITPQPRTSVEAQARSLRYLRLVEFCKKVNGAIITAHHRHDQMETMLLQLKRGAGPKGLGAMQRLSFKDDIPVIRPMLPIGQSKITSYAHAHKLTWVNDSSNQDERFDRNFLRQQIIPKLEERWPSISSAVARSANFCHEQALLLEDITHEKLLTLQDSQKKLDITQLLENSPVWQKQILREWLRQFFPMSPSSAILNQIQNILTAKEDSQPLIEIGEFSIRRFKYKLWCVNRFENLPSHRVIPASGVYLPAWDKTLVAKVIDGEQGTLAELEIITGMPAIKVRPIGKLHNKLIKEWLKAWEVPPWERLQIPIVQYAGTPVAICLEEKIISLQAAPSIPEFDFSYSVRSTITD